MSTFFKLKTFLSLVIFLNNSSWSLFDIEIYLPNLLQSWRGEKKQLSHPIFAFGIIKRRRKACPGLRCYLPS